MSHQRPHREFPARLCAWSPLLLLAILCCGWSSLQADDDALPNMWVGDAEIVRQDVLRTAELPGGEAAAQWADLPVIVWVERCFLGTDDVYTGQGTRYAVLRIQIANRTDVEIQLKRENITLAAGPNLLKLDGASGLLKETVLKIDWYADRDTRLKSQLQTPRNVKIPAGKGVAFWTVFAGIDAAPPIPELKLSLELDGGKTLDLDLTAQQRARLALTTQRIGPQQVLSILTIHGQLNRINSLALTEELVAQEEKGARRFIVEWAPTARPSDELLFGWLIAASASNREVNPQHLQLPVLPPMKQVLLAALPEPNSSIHEWEDFESVVFPGAREAAIYSLQELYKRGDARSLLKEIRTGHLWSKEAALIAGKDRLGSSALPLLLELSKSHDPGQQQAAIIALGAQSASAAEALLLGLAKSSNPDEARTALTALLWDLNPARRALVKSLLQEKQLSLPPDTVIALLAGHYHPDWDPTLIASVSDPDANVRRTGLEMLSRLGHSQLAQLCKGALADTDESVREMAFQILVESGDQDSEQAARQYALNRLREGHVDDSILSFVERVRETDAAPAILAEIRKPDIQRGRLISVIGDIGTDADIRTVLAGMDQYSEEERLIALHLVNRLPVDAQLEIARKNSTSKVVSVRRVVLEILASIGSEPAVALLSSMLMDEEALGSADLICSSLGLIGTDQAIGSLRKFRAKAVAAGDVNLIQCADRAIREWKSRLPGFSFVEVAYSHKEDREAIKAFSVALAINPELSDAYAGRGNLHLRQNEFELAAKDFARAMLLDPDDGQAVTGVAIIGAIQGKLHESTELVQNNARRFPNDRFFAYNTACVYSRCVEYLKKQEATPERDTQIALNQQRAIAKLKESLQLGFEDLKWMKADPDLAAIRDLPEFNQLGM